MVRHLEAAVRSALPASTGGWATVEDAAAALESRPRAGPSSSSMTRTGSRARRPRSPSAGSSSTRRRWLAIVIGSRLAAVDSTCSRLRVGGDLLEIGPDDLRFRAWEVERLFRDHYGEPVPPDELAVLARRTEGWAAGLQLFHLATRGKSAEERRRILAAVGAGSRLIREYLTWNVMADLPEELRDFLVETCVLGRLTGPLCDRLLDRRGSAALLDELYRRQIFTVELDEADELLPLPRGLPLAARPDARRAGRARRRLASATPRGRAARGGRSAVPRRSGRYSRAEDWVGGPPAARRPGRAARGRGAGLAREPAARDHPPRAVAGAGVGAASPGRGPLDGRARRIRTGRGRLRRVVDRPRLPSRTAGAPGLVRAGPAGAGDRLDEDPPGRRRPRAARRRPRRRPPGHRPAVVPAGAPGSRWPARSQMPGGSLPAARRGPRRLSRSTPHCAARWPLASRCVLAGDPVGAGRDRRCRGRRGPRRRAVARWLARAASRLGAPMASAAVDPALVAARSMPDRDPWGAAIVALIEAWEPGDRPVATGPRQRRGDGTAAERRAAAAERSAAGFRRLGAGVLEAWARGLHAIGLAESRSPEAREAATSAESLARAAGAPGVRLPDVPRHGLVDEARRTRVRVARGGGPAETGLVGPPPPADRQMPRSEVVAVGQKQPGRTDAKPPVIDDRPRSKRSTNGGTPVAAEPAPRRCGCARSAGSWPPWRASRCRSTAIKPRARSLLRLLAVHAGSAVHREVDRRGALAGGGWPDRRAQPPGRGFGRPRPVRRRDSVRRGRLIVREGDAYRLGVDRRRGRPAALRPRGRRRLAPLAGRGGRDAAEALAAALVGVRRRSAARGGSERVGRRASASTTGRRRSRSPARRPRLALLAGDSAGGDRGVPGRPCDRPLSRSRFGGS